jgi:hypothetical protein
MMNEREYESHCIQNYAFRLTIKKKLRVLLC